MIDEGARVGRDLRIDFRASQITTGWPTVADMRSPINRAVVSVGPPGTYGTTIVILRLGNACP
jgi:hypothetical protein